MPNKLGADSSEPAVDLNVCPLGDFDAMVALAPAGLKAVADVEGQLFTYVYQPEATEEPPHLQCGRGDLARLCHPNDLAELHALREW